MLVKLVLGKYHLSCILKSYSLDILGAVEPVNSNLEVKNDPCEKARSKKLKFSFLMQCI